MNEINIAEILKYAPRGTKLWSPICGECEFISIGCIKGEDYEIPIIETYSVKGYDLKRAITHYANFLKDGKLESCNSEDGECMLFPSKDNRDWSTFKVPRKHKVPRKYKHFEPFQKILIPNICSDISVWVADIYSHYRCGTHYTITGMGFSDNDIIPYKGNEDKLGKVIE